MENDDSDPRELYQFRNKLGKGAFATVYLAIRKGVKEPVAIKRVRLEKENADIDACRREVVALTRISSPYITSIYGAYTTGRQLWIVMEHMGGGSVEDLIVANGTLPDDAIARILFCSCAGLAYMHSRNQVHRDIKPDNILVTPDGHAKLCDLGVSYDELEDNSINGKEELGGPGEPAAKGETNPNDPRSWLPQPESQDMAKDSLDFSDFVGTPYYMAPEVIQQVGNGPKADIWSLGIAAIEMATGKCPRSDFHPMKAMLMTKQDNPPQLDHKNAKLIDFVSQCLQKDDMERASAAALEDHKFVKKLKKKAPKQLLACIQKHLQATEGHYSSGSEDDEDEQYNILGVDSRTEPWDFSR